MANFGYSVKNSKGQGSMFLKLNVSFDLILYAPSVCSIKVNEKTVTCLQHYGVVVSIVGLEFRGLGLECFNLFGTTDDYFCRHICRDTKRKG